MCDLAYVLLLEKFSRADPFGDGSDPAQMLDEQLLAEPKHVEPEMAELMDALGVGR